MNLTFNHAAGDGVVVNGGEGVNYLKFIAFPSAFGVASESKSAARALHVKVVTA
jgi:hypothetical protein